MTTALANSIALSTSKLYVSHFRKWKLWCTQFTEVIDFPAEDTYIALYLVNLLQSGYTFSTINSVYYGISFFHNSCGLVNPCHSNFLKAVLRGCKRLDARNPRLSRQKSPILPENLSSLVLRFAGPSAPLSDIRDVTLCLTGYAGFLRYNEISNIKWCHITVHESHLSLFLPRSKTDQLHVGSTVVIAKTGNPTCPYNMLLRYAAMAQADMSSTNFVFGNLTFHRSTNSYSIRQGSQLSYSRAREVILQKFKTIGVDTTSIGLHSLRIGGATAAANREIGDRAIKKHGRWKSDKSKDLYCREDLRHQLAVSLNLGI